MITNSVVMLQKARAEHYAVPAFNVNNLEWGKELLRAAEKLQSPVILQVTGGAAQYMGSFRLAYDLLVDLHEAMHITVPVAIHLDHGNYHQALETIGVGFTSVMFDGAKLPLAENLAKTNDLRTVTSQHQISLEAEVGTIGGEEDGLIANGEIAAIPDAVQMAQVGVDMLAVGIGNIHGQYPADWKGLNFAHLQKIDEAIFAATGKRLPLVLHGGSGIDDDQIRRAIELGIAKINVNTEGQLAFHDGIRKYVLADKDLEGKNFDPRIFLTAGSDQLEAMCEDRIRVFGSAGKA
ncbi:Fructose-bisphosphate aldolase class II [Fructilactobacillus florum 8D]|uniref:Fructose-bisphosphate aldolase class II n=1 Tax=Fructilactobacillus florum 8D TaxID=1221538 RepID=W9EEX5_9LACO|nr:ketose-bisphosphate aldolase [Fructilactobacillus florum]ETO40632.1 Fructose-bisphosphate aldolase class II [Fructilactobacillus florum 8D]